MGLLTGLIGIMHLLLHVMGLDLVAARLGTMKVSCFHLRTLSAKTLNAGRRHFKASAFLGREPVYSRMKEILALIR